MSSTSIFSPQIISAVFSSTVKTGNISEGAVASNVFQDITSLGTITAVASGLYPMIVGFMPDSETSTSSSGGIFMTNDGAHVVGQLRIVRGSTALKSQDICAISPTFAGSLKVASITVPAIFFTMDFPVAGSHIYKVQGAINDGVGGAHVVSSLTVSGVRLFAFEIKI
jgi:hypothetical protein